MPDDFIFDVFHSHSAKDKAMVRFSSLSLDPGAHEGELSKSVAARWAEDVPR